ncbi:hypothetical protein WSM22_42000 [Cytophagales bacterium WSM2-2]|nr:hypothetical protein WSM22_42000 [Cytophagales bacterium WSM2-2]
MLNTTLADFYERDIRKLIAEINSFEKEKDLWRTHGTIKNSSGNLALHIAGGLNYLIGTKLANTGYVRNRDLEFTTKDVERRILVAQLEELIPMISMTLNSFSLEQMESEYPIPFDDAKRSKSYVLLQLALHLNYHLGQVNYLRRALQSVE